MMMNTLADLSKLASNKIDKKIDENTMSVLPFTVTTNIIGSIGGASASNSEPTQEQSSVNEVQTPAQNTETTENTDNATVTSTDAQLQTAVPTHDANGKLILTDDNYYSEEANKQYMSVSQFKDFAGNLTKESCENTAYLKAKGIIPQPVTKALLQGSYVDAYFEGTLDQFKEENKDKLFKAKGGGLYADFVKSENIIERVKKDDVFMQYMAGEKQKIMTGNLFGVDWKIKMDSYFPDDKIVDLKCMKDMKPIWSDKLGMKMDFIRSWGYDIQGAIYQKIVEINTGKKLPFYIACATKEDITDIQIIEIDQNFLDDALKFVEDNIVHVMNVKNGFEIPKRCNKCAYCLSHKKLTQPIKLSDIIPKNPYDHDDDGSTNSFEGSDAGGDDMSTLDDMFS